MGMFENIMLRRTLGANWDRVLGSRIKLHDEDLCNLRVYSLLNVIRVIKPRRIRWARHMA
jgi:hypothetical protein